MSILHKRIEGLCVEKGITGYRLCKDIGISPNIMTELKMGRRDGISAKTANKIASYFGVTVAYLLGEEDKPTPVSESGQDRNIIKMAGRDGSFVERELTDDQLTLMKNMLDQLKPIDDDRI